MSCFDHYIDNFAGVISGDFVFIPGDAPERGELLLLGEPVPEFTTGSVVVVPYSEPAVRQPAPVFYPVLSRRRHTIPVHTPPAVRLYPSLTRAQYLEKIIELKSHIQRGDIYEVNYCIKFSTKEPTDPFSVFARLCGFSSAPYQLLARFGDRYVLCASPELFLKRTSRTLITKPIKGTTRRGGDPVEDRMLADRLRNSHKDRTENVMAVDVSRNDLSIIASKGSVNVNKLYNIESFQTVHQMVSTVSCQLRSEVSFGEIIGATFPMASMTGAPKTRAMQLIGEKESFERGFYSGTLGIISENGDFELPVLIRSVFTDSEHTWFATGGAITHLSDPAQEYEECLLKASTMLRALNGTIGV